MARLNKNPSRFLKKWVARSHAVLSTAAELGFPYSDTGRPLKEQSVEELGGHADRQCELLTALMEWCLVTSLKPKDSTLLELGQDALSLLESIDAKHINELRS